MYPLQDEKATSVFAHEYQRDVLSLTVVQCDNEYPTCSNCQKAGVTCDKSSVREDADRENE